jgi:hypothetical protein
MRNQIDLEVPDLWPVEADAHLLEESGGEDALTKFLSDWTHNIDSEALDTSLAHVHTRITNHYKKIAQDAEAATPQVTAPAPADATTLQKRFSQPDPRSAYREYFREQLAKGKSAAEILEAWCAEFPHRNPSVEKLMRETAEEFA